MTKTWRQALDRLQESAGLWAGGILLGESLDMRFRIRDLPAVLLVTAVALGFRLLLIHLVKVRRLPGRALAESNGAALVPFAESHLSMGRPGVFFLLFDLMVMTPIREESVYRGLLFFALAGSPPGVVVLVTSVLFARGHARGRELALPQLVGGIVAGCLCVRYGIWAAMLEHGLYNGVLTSLWVRGRLARGAARRG